MIYYKPIKGLMDASRLAEIILDIIIWNYGLLDLIITNKSSVFISKFWFSLYHF